MTTVKPLPSVKLATAAVKCEMAAEKSYLVWHQMMRELADKEIKRQREVDQERQVFELAKTMLAKKSQELANAEGEIKRLKHELHKAKESAESSLKGCAIALDENQSLRAQLTEVRTNTQNIPTNGSQDALDALKRIMQVDVSGRNAWNAHKEMQAIAKEVLGE